MKLSENSISVKIQKLAWGEHIDLCTNLCSHFWTTIFAAVFIFFGWPFIAAKKIIDKCCEALEKRKAKQIDALIEKGKNLTIDQVVDLMTRENLTFRFFSGSYTVDMYALFDLYRYGSQMNNNKYLILGWRRKTLGGSGVYDSFLHSSIMQPVFDAVDKLKKPHKPASKSTSTLVKIRTIFFSYVPVVYWTLAVCLSLGFAIIIGIAAGNDGGLFLGIIMTILPSIVIFVIFLFVYFGTDYDGINSLVYRYGKTIEDDIFFLYLKAVKEKMCPLIEWEK